MRGAVWSHVWPCATTGQTVVLLLGYTILCGRRRSYRNDVTARLAVTTTDRRLTTLCQNTDEQTGDDVMSPRHPRPSRYRSATLAAAQQRTVSCRPFDRDPTTDAVGRSLGRFWGRSTPLRISAVHLWRVKCAADRTNSSVHREDKRKIAVYS